MLINLSNHPSINWSEKQTNEANKLYGEVVDLPFPQVDPSANENYIDSLTDEYLTICQEKLHNSKDKSNAVHLMGELNFTFMLACKLLKTGIKCICSTTERNSIEKNGLKISEFKFVRFREYKLC